MFEKNTGVGVKLWAVIMLLGIGWGVMMIAVALDRGNMSSGDAYTILLFFVSTFLAVYEASKPNYDRPALLLSAVVLLGTAVQIVIQLTPQVVINYFFG